MDNIGAVIVTFNPDIEKLIRLIHSIQSQVGNIFLIDNGSANLHEIKSALNLIEKCTINALNYNLGLGYGLNKGVELAKRNENDFILFLDQDSIPSASMVDDLKNSFETLEKKAINVAAIGPQFIDSSNNSLSGHVVIKGFRILRIFATNDGSSIPVDFLITSGSLISTRALSDIGKFNEEIFIDHIDTEWVLRAKQKGYFIYGDFRATMVHSLGEYRKRIWLFRWRDIPFHKTFRYYYIFRNSIWLRKQHYANPSWKKADLFRLIYIFIFMSIFHPARFSFIRLASIGIIDGIRGNLGPYRNNK